MRSLLLSTTCLIAFAQPVYAQTTISTPYTTPVKTSTVKAGSSDDIVISAAGSITSKVPVAVLIDSNNKLTNDGSIKITDRSDSTAIFANDGVVSKIINNGSITVDETYAPTDNDQDGDLDGPFAQGRNRFGIRTGGLFDGDIINAGKIVVEGNESAGILLSGTLDGNLIHNGSTTITGDKSVGVSLNDVTGNVRLAGNIAAVGAETIAIQARGDVDGAMVIQGQVLSTGYRYTTVPKDVSKLDADDLLQGGPAVSIEGNLSRGLVIAVAPKDADPNDKDEDEDGIEDAKEGNAAIVSYGSAAALRVGSKDKDLTLGLVSDESNSSGLLIEGSIVGSGLYAGVDGNAVQLGGLGKNVTIAGGIEVTGTVAARSVDRVATAFSIAEGTSTPKLVNSGVIAAESLTDKASGTATAISIDEGASLTSLRNSGTIEAKVGGGKAEAAAVVDRSGTLSTIVNSGTIAAKGSEETGGNVALDLSANTAGVTLEQIAVVEGKPSPNIVGDILLGSGSDSVYIADGIQAGFIAFGNGDNHYRLSGDAVATGGIKFGAGNDAVKLEGTSKYTGDVDFGSGNDSLTLTDESEFSGRLLNSSGLNVTVSEAVLNIQGPADMASLSVADGSTLGVLLNGSLEDRTAINVSGAVSFDEGSKLKISVADIKTAEGTYSVLTAGTLTGGENLTADAALLPFLYTGILAADENSLKVTVARKNAEQLGLNDSESAAYNAVYEAIGTDKDVGGAFLGARSQEAFTSTMRQMLPDHAGGVFEAITLGERTASRILTDRDAPYVEVGRTGYWLGQLGFKSSKSIGSTAGFDVSGWGVTGGAEIQTPIGKVGGSVSYLWGDDDDRATGNGLISQQYGLAAHWRLEKSGLLATVRGGWSHVSLESHRFFKSDLEDAKVDKTMHSKWNGSLVSAATHLSYQLETGRFHVKPSAELEYFRLSEDAHQETGGGSALDLSISERKSDELAATGLIAAGINFGGKREDSTFYTLEVEGGRREILSGELGSTTAQFDDGDPFTLTPEERQSGWLGRVRVSGGAQGLKVVAEAGAEERETRTSYSGRIGLRFGF